MRPPALLLALLALGLLPSAAAAQTYAGGRFPWKPPKGQGTATSAGVVIDRSGSRAAVAFDGGFRCGKFVFLADDRVTASVNGDSLKATGRGRVSAGGADPRFRWSLKAQLTADSASGTLHIRSHRGKHSCRKVDDAVQLRATGATLSGTPAAPAGNALFVGVADGAFRRRIRSTVLVRVAPQGGRVRARWSVTARCKRGAPDFFTNYTPTTRIRGDGRFARSEHFTVRYNDATVRYRTLFRGRFRSDGASGQLRLRTAIYDKRGKRLLVRCDSGVRAWTALPAVSG